ncbi:MAG: T9SS type A sorting domain-containing protein, partial [Ignavibacteriota bacterium]
AWIVKVDPQGKLLWDKCIGGGKRDYANSIIQTPDSSIVFAGTTQSTDGDAIGNITGNLVMWVVQCKDSSISWQQYITYREAQSALSLCRTQDGGLVITGTIANNDTIAEDFIIRFSDILTVKLKSTGELLWQSCLGGSAYDGSYSIAATRDGGFIVAGYTNSIDGDLQVLMNSRPFGAYDAWIVKFAPDSKVEWSEVLGGTGDEQAYTIIQTSDGGYALAGTTGSNNGDVTSNPGRQLNSWIVKLKGNSSTVPIGKADSSPILILPNPASKEITVLYSLDDPTASNFSIYNLLGNRVIQTTDENPSIGARQLAIATRTLPQGLYMLKMETGKNIVTKKFIISR